MAFGRDKKRKGNEKGGMDCVELRRRIDDAFQWTTRERRQSLIAVAFAEGDQWKSADRDGIRLVDVAPPQGRDVETVTRNLFGPALRNVAQRLSRPLQFEVMARGADDVSRESAQLATVVINDTAAEHEFDELNRSFIWDLLTGGTAALILQWDPNGGGAGVDPLTGEEFGTGDIVVSTADIGQFAVQPGSKGVKAHWFVWARTMDPLEAQELYGLAEPPKGDTSIGGLSFGARRGAPQEGHCTVYTYFERPHGKVKGGIWTIIGNDIVEFTEWWYPFTDRLPLSIARDAVQPRRWQGYATAWDAIDPQVEVNETLTSIREAVTRFGDPKLIAPLEFDRDQLEERTDIINVDNPSAEPKWLDPLRISPELPSYGREAAQAVDATLGNAEVVKGAAPTGVSSGTALAALIEQANEFFAGYAQEVARCWSDMASMILQVLEVKVTDPEVRTARVREHDSFTTEVRWNGDMLNGHTNAVVPAQSLMPKNFAAALAIADSLKEKFPDQIDLRTWSLIADTAGEAVDVVEPDYACAMEENHRMWEGRPCEPEEIDDHEVHMSVLTTFMKTRRFRDLRCKLDFDADKVATCSVHDVAGEPCKAIFYNHLQAHRSMAMQHSGQLAAQHPIAAATPDGIPVPDRVADVLGQMPAPETQADRAGVQQAFPDAGVPMGAPEAAPQMLA